MSIGLVDFDGCGDGDRALAYWEGLSSVTVGTTYGTFSGYGFKVFAGGQAIRPIPASSHHFIGFHAYSNINNNPNTGPEFEIRTGTTVHLTIRFPEDGTVQVIGPTGSLLGTISAFLLPFRAWNYFEIEYVIDDAVGLVRIWLFGVATPMLELTGIDTKNAAASANANKIRWTGVAGNEIWIDDLYVVDGTVGGAVHLGSKRVTSRDANADGTPLEWDPSTAGTHFNLVNEKPFSGIEYVQTNVNGERDLYATADDGIAFSVDGVRLVGQMRKNDVLTAQARLILKDGANYGNGAVRNLSDTSQVFSDVFGVRPAGAGNWDNASVDAMLVGAEKVT